jgi:bifunctional non-homologous end joining protein LigD
MPESIEPMKARLDDPDEGVDWEFEVKWDGYRAIAFCGDALRLQGRRLNEIGPDFPEIKPLGQDRQARGLVLDGELVVSDENGRPDFQLMQSRRELQLEAHFMIFDLLWAEGHDLRTDPYRERRERLEGMGLAGPNWSVPDRLDGSLADVMEATAALGLEGVIAKDPDSPYVSGRRTGYWLKVKHLRRQEFVVGGWLPGKGHRADTLGSLLVGVSDGASDRLRFAGRIGTGMGDELLTELSTRLRESARPDSPFRDEDIAAIPSNAAWCEPRIVIEAKFTEWTRDGRLRNPVFLGFRPDKTPAEVVREETP